MNWTEEQLADWKRQKGSTGASGAFPRSAAKVPKPRLNKWEQEYAQYLEAARQAGTIRWYGFEAIKLRLASGTYYTPDFAVLNTDNELEFREIKGFWRDDALVKFKVAAEHFPFRFLALRKKRVSEGGGWEVLKDIGTGVCERVG